MAACAHCAAPLETPLVCGACGRLNRIETDPSPFEVLGVPVSQALDVPDLRRRLLRFTRLAHPDYFATGPAAERERAERATALLNHAFETLSDEIARADFLVRHLGGPDENEERQMPRDFLAEVLEWNEVFEEARSDPRAASTARLAELEADLSSRREQALRKLAELLDPLPDRGDDALRRARRALNALRYVDRALAEIGDLRLARAEARG